MEWEKRIHEYRNGGMTMRMFRKFMVCAVVATVLFSLAGIALAAETAAVPATATVAAPAADVVAPDVEEEEIELTYQQQASALIDTVIEDYTVRMAALQAIIDMREDDIAGLKDAAKKLNDNIKLLTAIQKAALRIDKDLRPIFLAMADGDQKTAAIDVLDRLIAANDKFVAAQ